MQSGNDKETARRRTVFIAAIHLPYSHHPRVQAMDCWAAADLQSMVFQVNSPPDTVPLHEAHVLQPAFASWRARHPLRNISRCDLLHRIALHISLSLSLSWR